MIDTDKNKIFIHYHGYPKDRLRELETLASVLKIPYELPKEPVSPSHIHAWCALCIGLMIEVLENNGVNFAYYFNEERLLSEEGDLKRVTFKL